MLHIVSPRWSGHLARLALLFVVAGLVATGAAAAQDAPADFTISVETRPTHEFDVEDVILVMMDAQGATSIKDFVLGGEYREAMSITLDQSARDQIWAQVVEADFFNRDSTYHNERVMGGDLAVITVTANGQRHAVQLINYPLPVVDRIVGILNSHIPPGHQIFYNALVYPDAYGPMEEQ